ncbi:MAG: hypothetical protein VB142_10585 [Burkholderia sp.]
MRPEVIATPPIKPEIAKPAVPVGTIEVWIGRAVVKVDGVVDPDMLRTVLESLRSDLFAYRYTYPGKRLGKAGPPFARA